MAMNIAQAARLAPDKAAVIFADGTQRSFAELDLQSNRIAHLFRQRGLKTDDAVAFIMGNETGFAEIMVAASRAGLYFTPLPRASTPPEARHVVSDSGARLLIVSAQHAELGRALSGDVDVLIAGPAQDGLNSLDAALSGLPETPIADQAYGRDMLYSSGTTGRPKGVRKPRPTTPFEIEDDTKSLASIFALGTDVVLLVPGPLYHSAGLHALQHALGAGATTVVMQKFDARRALELMAEHKVTHSQWVPTMFSRLLDLDPAVRNGFDLSSHREASHGAAPCSAAVKRAMIDWWGPIVNEYYGGTEGFGACTISSTEWLAHPGSVGKPAVGEIHILDAEGRELPAGEAGRIFFSGGPAFEYVGAANAGDAPGDGLQSYGDVGYVDDEGYLYLTDRASDMIISGGVNIYPREVEQALLSHPLVRDVAVFGVPDEKFGESVRAVIELHSGAIESAGLRDALLEHLRPLLASHKLPRSIDFMDALPRGENGKLYKRQLRDSWWQAAGRSI